MKNIILCAAVLVCGMQAQAADVGVSISIGEPGLYGRIDIGNAPRPQVIYAEPVVIYRQATVVEPVYMRVPPGHAKDWRKHCKHYNACSRPVYFVQDGWYQDVYAPHYRESRGHKDKGPKGRNDNGHKDKGPKGNKGRD